MSKPDLYSPRIHELCNQIRSATDREQRQSLMLELAGVAAEEHDFTDTELVDEYHAYFEDFVEAAQKARETAMRVSRLICAGVERIESTQVQGKLN